MLDWLKDSAIGVLKFIGIIALVFAIGYMITPDYSDEFKAKYEAGYEDGYEDGYEEALYSDDYYDKLFDDLYFIEDEKVIDMLDDFMLEDKGKEIFYNWLEVYLSDEDEKTLDIIESYKDYTYEDRETN